MNITELHVGTIGFIFERTVQEAGAVVDIRTATVKQMLFKAKAGEVKVKEASFKTDGQDGTLIYTTVAGDLDVPGEWGLQIALAMPAGTFYSNIEKFQVHENLKEIATEDV